MHSAILAYLQYLRDISRKIVERTDFDKIFITNAKTRPTFTRQLFDLDSKISQANPLYSYLEQTTAYLEKNLDSRLFIGFGMIAGTCKKRRLAGPLLFAELIIDRVEEISAYEWQIDLSTLSLNYDLLSAITGNLQNEEDNQWSAELETELNLIEHFEKEINSLFGEGNFDINKIIDFSKKYFRQGYIKAVHINQTLYEFLSQYAELVFSRCRILLPAFHDIKPYEISYRLQDQIELYQLRSQPKKRLRPSVFEQDPVFISAVHTFVNKIPNQLSTYQALSTLYQKIAKEELEFENQILEGLLHNILSLQVENLKEITTPDSTTLIDDAFIKRYIPLSLNPSQKKAIEFAYHYPISYIQGPPGSGKSHTIVAILLSALVLGKTVLVTSQKEAALDVLKEKLEPLLSNTLFSQSLLYFNREAKKDLRTYYKKLIQLAKDKKELIFQTEALLKELKETEQKLESLFQKHIGLEKEIEDTLTQIHYYATQQEILNQHKRDFLTKFNLPSTQNLTIVPLADVERAKYLTQKFIAIEKQKVKNHLLHFHARRFKKALIEKLKADKNLLNAHFIEYAKSWVNLSIQLTEVLNAEAQIKADPNHLRFDLAKAKEEVEQVQLQFLRLLIQVKLLQALQQKDFVIELTKLEKMLYWNKPGVVAQKMQEINFHCLLEGLPLWAVDIRNLGQAFPIQANLFDLVVVDEASQVNLAEILPALYRGKRFCIVGDHLQLSLHSTGLNFQLSNKFDSYCWHKYKPAGLSYEDATLHALTVSQSSILDFIRSEANYFSVPTVLLNEHYRSMPALAQFTARFYQSEQNSLKVMTETPEKLNQYSFQAICVGSTRSENKYHIKEAQEVLRIVQELLQNTSYSIGIVSFLRSQCNYVEELLVNEISEEQWQKCDLIIGTPEELQGHERDVIIITPALDASCRHSVAHYQNPRRFNVATSRAKLFTYFIYGSLPDNFELFHQYLRHFEKIYSSKAIPGWQSQPVSVQVEIYHCTNQILVEFCQNHGLQLLYNGKSCGFEGLEWAIYSPASNQYALVLLEGINLQFPTRFNSCYVSDFIQKIEVLKRAGWKIHLVSYPHSYMQGELPSKDSLNWKNWQQKIYYSLSVLLGLRQPVS
ncbi:MAG: AAA domain-containing protein [Bacteroidia bacterium]|nr:AAA domain-containing protein [Bacteroidia bacterium]MDW8158848.1 AAA domain-containing protein [Bacteroidia bacterium]